MTFSPPHRRAVDVLWRGRSVRAQLLMVFVLIDVVAALVGGSVAIVRARVQTRIEMTASIRLAELLVSDAVSLARQAVPAEQFLEALPAQLQSIRHVHLQVKDAAGAPIAASPPADKADTRLDAARSPAPAWFEALVAPPVASRDVPVTIDGRTIGRVEISGEPADEIAEVWDNLVAIGTIGILLNAAMIALLYVVFGRVLDPLTVLAAGLSDLEHQSYNVRLPTPRARELSVITDHFNALAAALATARAENLNLNRRLITAQDDERRRTALELHDEVGPCLFGLKANASSIAGAAADLPDKTRLMVSERLQDIRGIIEHLQTINRSMLDRLRPMALGHVPLAELLGQLVHERARQHPEISFFVCPRRAQTQLRRFNRFDGLSLRAGKPDQRGAPRAGQAHQHRACRSRRRTRSHRARRRPGHGGGRTRWLRPSRHAGARRRVGRPLPCRKRVRPRHQRQHQPPSDRDRAKTPARGRAGDGA